MSKAEMPVINLTKAVEEMARELYASNASMTNRGRDTAAYLAAIDRWLSTVSGVAMPEFQKTPWRRLALASLTPETVADIARQVWDVAQQSTIEDHGDTCRRAYAIRDNPWSVDLDDELKKLME